MESQLPILPNILLTTDNFDPQYYTSLLKRSLKKTSEDVLASINGYSTELKQKICIVIVREDLKYIESLDDTINKMIQKHNSPIDLLHTIPGIARSSAITVISEIETDTLQFGYSKKLYYLDRIDTRKQ